MWISAGVVVPEPRSSLSSDARSALALSHLAAIDGLALLPRARVYSSVVFTAQPGGNGQSGTFAFNSSGTRSMSTDGSGIANPGTFNANGAAGAYTVDVAAGTAPPDRLPGYRRC
jgi:hypothetical protein